MFASLWRSLQSFRKPSVARQRRRFGARPLSYRPRVEALEERIVLDSVHWQAASGNWSSAGNWAPHAPGVGDTAIIDAAGTYSVTLDVDATVAGFSLNSADASFYATSRTITVNGPAVLSAGSLLWNNSTWAGTGTLTNNANMTFYAASAISSPFVQNGSVLVQAVPGAHGARLTAASSFTNAGTITLESADDPGNGSCTLAVTSGTLTNAATGVINFNPANGGSRTLAANLTNNGTVNLNFDTTFSKDNGGYTNNSAFNIAAGQTLTISGSSQTFDQHDGILNNAGGFSMSALSGIVLAHATSRTTRRHRLWIFRGITPAAAPA